MPLANSRIAAGDYGSLRLEAQTASHRLMLVRSGGVVAWCGSVASISRSSLSPALARLSCICASSNSIAASRRLSFLQHRLVPILCQGKDQFSLPINTSFLLDDMLLGH